MAGMLLATHPRQVQDAINRYRDELNHNPAAYVNESFLPMNGEIREVAAKYMNAKPEEVANTDSTTMGTALVFAGLQIRNDQEIITHEYDYYSTHQSIEYLSSRTGVKVRKIPSYKKIHQVTKEEIVDKLINAIKPETRLVTATWVHSSTGLKVPVKEISSRLAEINASRDLNDRVIFFVDGVHGFGVEDTSVAELDCDFFAAGTHKWIFGPRGTGILWGHSRAHQDVKPIIPTFNQSGGWGGTMSPGGFKAFEHEWALIEAFKFHEEIGKSKVKERLHAFARQLKEGLDNIDRITLITPMEESLSSGIVCFDVDGMQPVDVVRALREKNIEASDTPYSPTFARLTPGIYNTEEEMELVLKAVYEVSR